MRRGLVLGCGGPVGFAWSAVALASIEAEFGWDARDAAIIQGTSAGAELAMLLGAGLSVTEILGELDAAVSGTRSNSPLGARLSHDPRAIPPVPRPVWPATGLLIAGLRRRVDATAALAGVLPVGRGNADFLRDFAESLAPDWVAHRGVRLVAADAGTGELAAFGAADAVTLQDALAASWAIPGWFPPVLIHGRRYLDGGTVSPTSAHLLVDDDLDEVVIVAPMSTRGGATARGAARVERLMRQAMTRRVDREVAVLESAGIRVVRIEPNADELSAMGANFMDARRRAATMQAARDHRPTAQPLERQR